MSVDFSEWSAAQTPVVTILVLAAIGVVAGVVCRLVLRRLYPLGYGQIGEPQMSVLAGFLFFMASFGICMSFGLSLNGHPSDFDGALAESYGFESTVGTAPAGPPYPMEPNTASLSARVERA